MLAIVIMAARFITTTSFPGSNFVHLPKPQLVCVPSSTKRGCSEVELINLHAIPEEKRVVFLFSKLSSNGATPVLRYKPAKNWQCDFGEGVSTPIQCLHRKMLGNEPRIRAYFQYNHLSLAQCALPPSMSTAPSHNQVLNVTVTLGTTEKRFQYSLHVKRWKRKKLLGMCLRWGSLCLFTISLAART